MTDTCTVDDCNRPPQTVKLPGLTARQTYGTITMAYIDRGWDEETENDDDLLMYRTKLRKSGQMVMVTLQEYL